MDINKIINGDCVTEMNRMPENSVDLIVTSPPYNVGMEYDIYQDDCTMENYWDFTKNWLRASYRILKSDGRIAINIPYEINVQDRGGRVLFMAEFWRYMRDMGFKFFGLVDLNETSPHRTKTTAWGSWMSPSSPYIYNPKECVILGYKSKHKKIVRGEPQWVGVIDKIVAEDGSTKNKTLYTEEQKKEFMDLVYGQWDYFADTKQMTKATFSMDIPLKAIKILTYKNDLVLDPFAGSGTSLVAAVVSGRNWLGIEISENYCNIAQKRVQQFIDSKKQSELEI